MAREIILVRAHQDTPAIRAQVQALRAALPDRDLAVVAFLNQPPADFFAGAPITTCHVTTPAAIAALPYGQKSADFRADRTTGNNDLPVLDFFRLHPGHDHYWIVEYDVRWSGDWGELFAELAASPADLLAANIEPYANNPDWTWWATMGHQGRQLPESYRLKAFLPFCRLSRAALHAIDSGYGAGVVGHYEATWPSLCQMAQLRVEDIGGQGSFTPPARRGRFYTNTPAALDMSPGSFVFRPAITEGDLRRMAIGRPPMLWHPVKD